MKYMGNYYHGMGTLELRKLRSTKYVRLTRLNNDAGGYFHTRETARLKAQISWIDAVLQSRELQVSLF